MRPDTLLSIIDDSCIIDIESSTMMKNYELWNEKSYQELLWQLAGAIMFENHINTRLTWSEDYSIEYLIGFCKSYAGTLRSLAERSEKTATMFTNMIVPVETVLDILRGML